MLVAPPGFDSSKWDPCKDIFLPKTYSADNMDGKVVCKVTLQERAGLPANASVALVSGPLIFCFSLAHMFCVGCSVLCSFNACFGETGLKFLHGLYLFEDATDACA